MAPKRSMIWDHFVDKDNDKAQCKYCKVDISYKSSVSNLTKHINRKHGTIQLVPRQGTSATVGVAVAANTALTQAENSVAGSATLQPMNPPPTSLQQQTGAPTFRNTMTSYLRRDCSKIKKDVDRHIMNLFIYDLQPFSIVEDRGFRELITFAFPNYTIPTRKFYANNMLPALYEVTKAEVKELLNAEMISICLSTDMWTSRNGDWFLGLTGHFLDTNYGLRTVLLECCVLSGVSHTATALAEELSRIVREWNIESKILLAVSDNGSNIKCAIEKCLGWKHFNCYAHCLNLVVGKALENNITIASIIQNAKAIVQYFKKSTVAWDKLKRYLEQAGKPIKRPLQEVPTRWNSTFYMLQRLLELKEEVNSALSNLNANISALTPNDWIIIENLVQVLKPCEEVTKEISGDKYVTGSSVIPITIALKSALVAFVLDGATPLPDEVEMVRQDIFSGLQTRFSSLENSRTFTTCMFLDPRYKLYFENEHTADSTKKYVISLVTSLISEENSTSVVPETLSDKSEREQSIWSHYYSKMQNVRPSGTAYSRAVVEVQRYIDDAIIPKNDSPLEWWKANKNSYPHLALLARTKLNALATSVPCERLFSVAGNILCDRRTRLGVRKVQQLLFLQQNLKK